MEISLLSGACSIDDLELIDIVEVKQVQQESIAGEAARQDFQARFNGRSVISIKIGKTLPEGEVSSGSGWGGKFKIIRGIGTVVGAIRSVVYSPLNLTLLSELPSDQIIFDGNPEPDVHRYGGGVSVAPIPLSQSANSASTVIECSDEVLAYKLGEGNFRVFAYTGSLFGGDGPKLSDIQQSDNRSTCSTLSSAAAYIASSFGSKLFRQMFTEDDGDVCVRLFSGLLDKDVIVRVRCSIVIGKSGQSLFSMPETGKFYMVALEKALLSLNLSYKQIADECVAQSNHEFKEHWLRLLEGRIGESGEVKLDHLNPARILEHFPSVNINAKYPFERPESIWLLPLDCRKNKDAWEDTKRLLEYNARRKVPMVFGTRTGLQGVVSTLKTGTPTGHSVALLSFAVETQSGKGGVLIFDPYGNSLGAVLSGLEKIIYGKDSQIELNGEASPLQFVPLDQIPERFSEITIAAGGESSIPERPEEETFCFLDKE